MNFIKPLLLFIYFLDITRKFGFVMISQPTRKPLFYTRLLCIFYCSFASNTLVSSVSTCLDRGIGGKFSARNVCKTATFYVEHLKRLYMNICCDGYVRRCTKIANEMFFREIRRVFFKGGKKITYLIFFRCVTGVLPVSR